MNKISLSLIPLIFALFACVAPDKGVPEPMACEPYPGPEPDCHDDASQNKNEPHVMINSKSLRVTPACVRASRTAQFVVNLTPKANNEIGSARIFPKGGNEWPVGTNNFDKDVITIDIPDELPLGYYKYGFEVNGRCVDPRVHVEN